jgi:catalase
VRTGFRSFNEPSGEGGKARIRAESFADHFSQPRRFWLSMSPVEREHIIGAYTFELAKCYEQAIRERTLQVLANIDPELCAGVAEGLGLPAPAPTVPLADVEPSPALSQVGGTWPLDGRVVGIVTGGADLEGVGAVREAVLNAGMVPLVVAPTGGTLGSGDAALTVQRSYVTARSVEFDAVLLAGAPDMGGDAYTPRDYKAGPAPAGQATIDPRVSLLVSEAFRHGKAIGVWAGGETALEASGVPAGSAGVVVAESGTAALEQVTQLMGSHRVWERFTTPRG